MNTSKKNYSLYNDKTSHIQQDTGFNFSRNYVTFPPHHIKGERIYDSQSKTDMKIVTAFSYYNREIPKEIITDLGLNARFQQLNLYTLFASLNSENQQEVIAWCNHFGFPDGEAIFDPTEKQLFYPISIFKSHVQTFRDVLSVINILHTNPNSVGFLIDEIAKHHNGLLPGLIYGYNVQKENVDILSDCQENQLKYEYQKKYIEPEVLALQYINCILSYYLSEISPSIAFSCHDKIGVPNLTWTSGPFIAQLYFMLVLDLTSGRHPRLCMNSKCGRYFTPSRPRAIYCSETCKERAKQHRHYLRNKLSKHQ